jgi:hypothetical protein
MGRIRMPEGKKVACCFCLDNDALALWLGFFRFPTANHCHVASRSRRRHATHSQYPRIEWHMEEVAKPEEYRRDLQQLIAGSPLNYLA